MILEFLFVAIYIYIYITVLALLWDMFVILSNFSFDKVNINKVILMNFCLRFLMLIFFVSRIFGEVFRGIWNGTNVAIKVFLGQDLTIENIEDFCNEISILICYPYPLIALDSHLFLFLFWWIFPFCFSLWYSHLRHPNGNLLNLVWLIYTF